MKKRLSILFLILTVLMTTSAFADGGWEPDGKCATNLFTQISCYFEQVWDYLVL